MNCLPLAGVTTRTSELFQQEGIQDDWLVLGQVTTPEPNNLTSRRTWLIGKDSQKIVLVLEYTFGTAEFASVVAKRHGLFGQKQCITLRHILCVLRLSRLTLAPSFAEIRGYKTISRFFE